MAETTGTSVSAPKLINLYKLSSRYGSYNELRDPILGLNYYRTLAQIDQNDLNLATVIGINRAG
jgi:hypothetical protein